MPRALIAVNWKMQAGLADGHTLAAAVRESLVQAGGASAPFDMAVAPPMPILAAIAGETAGSPLALGAQDCHAQDTGAHTGDSSPAVLAELGCRYVIVGHSERRQDHGEGDGDVQAKAAAVLRHGMTAIICIGESEAQRDGGQTLDVLSRQLEGSIPSGARGDNTVIAYEPVWAIGTGRTPSNEDIAQAHQHIRARIDGRVADAAEVRLLYGGSVKPANAAEILAIEGVNGALVGGASLKSADFWGIAQSLPAMM
jgi:triosephosphate isomerase